MWEGINEKLLKSEMNFVQTECPWPETTSGTIVIALLPAPLSVMFTSLALHS